LLTFADMAAILSEVLSRPVQHVPISFEDFHKGLEDSAGEFIADVFTGIARETLDGRNSNLCDGVQRAIGRAPRDFAEFARDAARAGAWSDAA